MNAVFDAHGDDLEFVHSFLADGAVDAGQVMARRSAWRICSANGWFSVFSTKPRGKDTCPGREVHVDLMGRDFTASASNGVWLGDITGHRTLQGKL